MTIPKVSPEAVSVFSFEEVSRATKVARDAWNGIRPVGSTPWEQLPDLMQTLAIVAARDAFVAVESLIRSMVIDEAAGVLKRARDEIERLEYPYIGESAASVIADIDASIRQLGERGR